LYLRLIVLTISAVWYWSEHEIFSPMFTLPCRWPRC